MPTTMSEILGAQAEPHTIAHNGKVYKAQVISQRLKTAVERHLENRDKAPILALASSVSPEVLAHMLAPHTNRVKGKDFRWHGPEHLKWLRTTEGMQEFVGIIFGISDPAELLDLVLAKMPDVQLVIKQVIRESLSPAELAAVERAEAEAEKKRQEGGAEASEEVPFVAAT